MNVNCDNCGWFGTDDELEQLKNYNGGSFESSCPNCCSTELEWEEESEDDERK